MLTSNSDICDICGKLIASDKPRTEVTQHLFSESRCQCILPERAPAKSLLNPHPEAVAAKKEQGQAIKFVTPQNELATAVSLRKVPTPAEEIARVQSNLPARYQISELLGQGGMGAVFKAFDQERQSVVAVKVISPQMINDPTAIRRFDQEAKLASTIFHPNIANIYDAGVGTEGAPYLVMEYVEGVSLEKLLTREGPLKAKRAVDLCLQVVHALEAAHAQNILHRDVKPSNIIVTTSSAGEKVKLTDFGIAKSLLPSADVSQSITQTGLMIGSPMYMSPEQCEGKEIDQRSDIYSIGCVLYKCLCGSGPFESENAVKVLLQHIEEEPMPICSKVPDHISDDLNYIVMSCLDKDPEKRYYNATQLAEDLECRKAGRRIKFHSDKDYSPVHIVRTEKGGSEDDWYPYEAVTYNKTGWKAPETPYAGNPGLNFNLIMIALFSAWFVVPFITIGVFNNSPKYKAADLIRERDKVTNSSDISTAVILADPESLRDAVLKLSAEGQTALRNGRYAIAANQFGKLAEIFRLKKNQLLEADSLYYLAHCQANLNRNKQASENYADALALYREVDAGALPTLKDRAASEAQSLNAKKVNDSNSKK